MEIGGTSAQGIAETYTFPDARANQVVLHDLHGKQIVKTFARSNVSS